MSADPEAPADPQRMSGGHVIKNMIYSHTEGNKLEIVTGWADQGVVREYNQETVRPAREGMHKQHPCLALNQELLRCSYACPPEMKLGGRTATCNDERQLLMKCLVKNKNWSESNIAPAPWYKPWQR